MDWRNIAAQELEAMGSFASPWLRPAFHAVDREAFAPARFWSQTTDADGLHQVIDRDQDEDAWRRAVWDNHHSLVVQMDDGRTPMDGPAKGDYSSSISAPDIVFRKLNALGLEQGQRVLHIGTASGYDTALLCERTGSDNVTSIEYDPDLAAWGAENLRAAGYSPTLVQGDGLEGWKTSAPPESVIATCAVREIPTAWRHQAADEAVILTPYNTSYARGGLLKMRVNNTVASGRFIGAAWYMWARQHRPNSDLHPAQDAHHEASLIHPDQIFGWDWQVDFAIGLHVPDISFAHRGEGEDRQVQLWDAAGTSVAIVNYGAWYARDAVAVYGERNLWAEVVDAHATWRTAGSAHFTRYGLTVDDDATWLWLDTPANTVQSTERPKRGFLTTPPAKPLR
ncbi:protein-L-isoaspartate O-methyltransferase [Streptomyces sp. NPDC057302]|uniref:protein-L-isoaspartate O-methyltransferase family protein n=1 Tax=Streptomyces sp. NPDC057302 TaxID=3346094 RepID=UPI00363A2E60